MAGLQAADQQDRADDRQQRRAYRPGCEIEHAGAVEQQQQTECGDQQTAHQRGQIGRALHGCAFVVGTAGTGGTAGTAGTAGATGTLGTGRTLTFTPGTSGRTSITPIPT